MRAQRRGQSLGRFERETRALFADMFPAEAASIDDGRISSEARAESLDFARGFRDVRVRNAESGRCVGCLRKLR